MSDVPGFVVPVHRALTEPILLGGAPRAIAIVNGTVAAAMGLGLQQWIAGLVLWIEPRKPGEPWHLVPFCWLPDEELKRKEEVDRVPYLAWRAAGHLETTPGRAVSKLHVAKKLAELDALFDIVAIGYDRWRIEDFKSLAADNAVPLPEMIPFGQGFKDMSPALEATETHLLNGTVVHPSHPVLTWCAANAVAVADPAENRKLDKSKATGRIDLMVATVMGAGLVARQAPVMSIDDFIANPIIF